MVQQKRSEVQEMFLTSLSKSQCDGIHEAAMTILEKTGVVFQCQEALDIFKKAGIKVEGDRVFLDQAMVDWALKATPSQFTLHDQEGNPTHSVGGRTCLYGTGSDCLNILDHRTGQRRDPLISDLAELVTLCDALPNIDFLMSMVIPTDYPPEIGDRIQMEIMLRYSSKPIIAVSFTQQGTRDIIEMAEIAAGGEEALQKRPFIIHYIQPVRALVHNEDTVLKLLHTARKGLPLVYLVSAIMGISSPITAAGYQCMGAAGQLAAIVLIQLVHEGTPVVVRGGRIVVNDMKTMFATIADPGNRIFSSDMAHYYDLPCFGTAGVSDSKAADWQAVAEASLTLMADSLVGANLIHDVGYIEGGVTYSAEMLVLCDEIISWLKTFKQGAPVNEETLALDLIHELGFEGDFLNTQHTFDHFREQWTPGLFDRNEHSKWKKAGSMETKDRIGRRIEEILDGQKHQDLPKEVLQRIRVISERAKSEAA
jgi:trimethylamine--corrinoid protein Co-methyltransferase